MILPTFYFFLNSILVQFLWISRKFSAFGRWKVFTRNLIFLLDKGLAWTAILDFPPAL